MFVDLLIYSIVKITFVYSCLDFQRSLTTSANHSEIVALYEASRDCVWLRGMINHIQQSCGIGVIDSPTIIYEDNAACVSQMQTCYIKSNTTKHISPKLF